jgi:hypothetical protein
MKYLLPLLMILPLNAFAEPTVSQKGDYFILEEGSAVYCEVGTYVRETAYILNKKLLMMNAKDYLSIVDGDGKNEIRVFPPFKNISAPMIVDGRRDAYVCVTITK